MLKFHTIQFLLFNNSYDKEEMTCSISTLQTCQKVVSLYNLGKSGKRTFQPITTLYEDYPYSVNVTAQTKHHHYVETLLCKEVSTFLAQAYCGSISSICGYIAI